MLLISGALLKINHESLSKVLSSFPSQLIFQNGIIGSHLKKSFTRERNDWLGFYIGVPLPVGFPGGSLVKNLPGNARDAGD